MSAITDCEFNASGTKLTSPVGNAFHNKHVRLNVVSKHLSDKQIVKKFTPPIGEWAKYTLIRFFWFFWCARVTEVVERTRTCTKHKSTNRYRVETRNRYVQCTRKIHIKFISLRT